MVYLFLLYVSSAVPFILYLADVIGFRAVRDALVVNFIWLIPVIVFSNQLKRTLKIIGAILLFFSLPAFGYFYIYHSEFSQSLIFILLDTNPNEAGEFLEHYFRWSIIPATIIYLSVPFVLLKFIQPQPMSKNSKLISVISILLILLMHPYLKGMSYDGMVKLLKRKLEPSTPWQLLIGYDEYQKQLATMTASFEKLKDIQPLKNFTQVKSDSPNNIILVIGENTNRFHLSAYGYHRDTTPYLKQDKDITLFQEVYAPRPNTIESLQQVLTFADEKSPDLFNEKPSIIALMKQAGYKTFWISNQQTLTKRNTMLTAFSKLADQQFYLNTSREQNAYSFDEKVLDPLKQVLSSSDNKKFIVVHLLGTHMSYKYRYPENFDIFKTSQDLEPSLSETAKIRINEFDNAVRYHDHILNEILKLVKINQNPSLLVYLADHGDDVYDSGDRTFQGRNEARPTIPMYAIPFFVYQSDNWINFKKIPKENLKKRFNSNDLIYLMSDLSGFTYEGFNPSKSIASPQFTEKEILVGNPYGQNLAPLLPQ